MWLTLKLLHYFVNPFETLCTDLISVMRKQIRSSTKIVKAKLPDIYVIGFMVK